LHQFKDVRTSNLTHIFEDSATFNNNVLRRASAVTSCQTFSEKLGRTEEAAKILEKVIPTPSHYRIRLSLNDEQEQHARRTFTEPW
jgi:hypothetical protein